MRTKTIRTSKTVEATSTVSVRGPRSRVWAILEPPEFAFLSDPTTVLAGRLPGTPRGVGDIHYSVHDRPGVGRLLSGSEVTEYEEDRRAVTRSLGVSSFRQTVETTLEDSGEDVIVTHRFVAHFEAGTHAHVVSEYEENMATFVREIDERFPGILNG